MQRTIPYTSDIGRAAEKAGDARAKLVFLTNTLAVIDSAGEPIDAGGVEGLCYMLGDAADAIGELLTALDEARHADEGQATEPTE